MPVFRTFIAFLAIFTGAMALFAAEAADKPRQVEIYSFAELVRRAEQIVVSSQPFTITSTKGINEDALAPDFYRRDDELYLPDDEEGDQLEGDEAIE